MKKVLVLLAIIGIIGVGCSSPTHIPFTLPDYSVPAQPSWVPPPYIPPPPVTEIVPPEEPVIPPEPAPVYGGGSNPTSPGYWYFPYIPPLVPTITIFWSSTIPITVTN